MRRRKQQRPSREGSISSFFLLDYSILDLPQSRSSESLRTGNLSTIKKINFSFRRLIDSGLKTQFPGSMLPCSRAVYINASAVAAFLKATPLQQLPDETVHTITFTWRPMLLVPLPFQRWRQCFSPRCGATSSSTIIQNSYRHVLCCYSMFMCISFSSMRPIRNVPWHIFSVGFQLCCF